ALPERRSLRAMVAGGLLGSSPLLWYELASWLATLRYMRSASQPLTAPLLAARLRGAAEVMLADREQRVIWGGPPNPQWQVVLGAALLLLVAAAALVRGGSAGVADPLAQARASWRRAFALAALLLLLILATSRLNVSQHHIAAILPLAAAALAILAVELGARS